jgi:hypothetical protein
LFCCFSDVNDELSVIPTRTKKEKPGGKFYITSKLSHGGDPWQRNNEVGVDTGVNPDAHQLIEIHILFFTSVHKDALDSEPGYMTKGDGWIGLQMSRFKIKTLNYYF